MSVLNDYKQIRSDFGKLLEKAQYNAELSCWNFYTNSTEENLKLYTQAQENYNALFKDEKTYQKLKEIQKTGLEDKHLEKQLKNLVKAFYNEIESGKELKALRDMENNTALKFNSHVMKIDDKPVTKAEITKILETETDVTVRQKAYVAKVSAGDVIADDMVEFVKLRNDYAKSKNYDNYFDYMIDDAYDISPEKLDELLGGVYSKIKDRCAEISEKNKKELAKEYGIEVSELKDYHYGLYPKNSPAKKVNEFIKTKEQVVELAAAVYKNMGCDIENSGITLDLFPRKNKNTHGFAFCVKPGKDARILANLSNSTGSIDTILHELGHCVYDTGLDTNLPFIEQEPSSPAMTEAVAMMMGDLACTENILKLLFPIPDILLTDFKNSLIKDEAGFVTKSLLIINFEREMYKNPEQNLKQLWKSMKQKYLSRAENSELNNEWAVIPHYLSHPGYYQNYFRAAIIKAQIYNALKIKFGNISETKEALKYLRANLFKYGSSVPEENLILNLTGKSLSVDDFCSRFE